MCRWSWNLPTKLDARVVCADRARLTRGLCVSSRTADKILDYNSGDITATTTVTDSNNKIIVKKKICKVIT